MNWNMSSILYRCKNNNKNKFFANKKRFFMCPLSFYFILYSIMSNEEMVKVQWTAMNLKFSTYKFLAIK